MGENTKTHILNRRDFLRISGSGLAALPFAGRMLGQSPKTRPNILVITSDDMGYNDVSCFGGEIPTPNIDALAATGTRFTDFYVSRPVCTPCRYSLLTGRRPIRSPNGLDRVQFPRSNGHLTEEEVTIASLLQRQGYRTGLIGKWHLGHKDKSYLPTHHGFDEFYGFALGCTDYVKFQYAELDDWYHNETPIKPEGYATDVLTDRAIDYLENQNNSQPFFLYLSYNAPHYGKVWDPQEKKRLNVLQAKPEDLEAFSHIEDPQRREYMAMVKSLDEGIGRVLAALEDKGLAKNTWVIFFTDNGAVEQHGGSNKPLRDGKGSLWEGGIRVPAAMRYPGRLESGSESSQLTSVLDIFPTICGTLGLETDDVLLDGMNLTDPLFSGRTKDRDLFWINVDGEAYRRGPWKYIKPFQKEQRYLFNLEQDIGENEDLAEKHPEILKELQAAHARIKESLKK